MFRPVAIVAAALLLGAPAYAQDRTAEVDRIFSWTTPDAPGCAVGVSQHGKVVVNRAYGLADLERGVPLTPSSIFDIGSTQKQFVAAAVLLLVEEGRLSLSDDVRKHVPELPDYGHEITIDHLLTHTSGLRDWIGLANFTRAEEEALAMILRQRGLNFAPGEEWSYSNSGYVLLKEIVARTSGTSFSEFARRRLFEPLGMTATMYADDIRAAKNGALAYEKEGDEWKPDMMLGKERGGGAVLTTAGDLLTWNEALTNARLGAFVTEKIQEPARLSNGRKLDYARGLIVGESSRGGPVVWHSGSARGFKSMLARLPAHGLSFAILCNAGDTADGMNLERHIVDLFAPGPRAAESDTGARAEDSGAKAVDPAGRAGLFFSERTGEPLRLVARDGRLRIAGGPPLVTVTADRFRNPNGVTRFMSGDEFELHFLSPDTFELRSMEGRATRYHRAQPFAPTTAELQALGGRYESEELNAVFDVAPASGGVTVRLNGERTLEFEPVDPGTFQRGMMTVRFRRDADGKIVALEYGNPMLRNVTFTRTGDGATGAPTPAAPPAQPAAAPAAPETPSAASSTPRLEALTGEYELAAGRILGVTLEDSRLYGQPPGGERRALEHVSGTTFSAVGTPITLTFTLGADGRATAVVMQQNGRERTLPRVR